MTTCTILTRALPGRLEITEASTYMRSVCDWSSTPVQSVWGSRPISRCHFWSLDTSHSSRPVSMSHSILRVYFYNSVTLSVSPCLRVSHNPEYPTNIQSSKSDCLWAAGTSPGGEKMALAGEQNTTENFYTDNKQRAGPERQWPPRPPLTEWGGVRGGTEFQLELERRDLSSNTVSPLSLPTPTTHRTDTPIVT